MFDATILLDSISETGKRLTTMQITFPRPVHAELNTHRALSKNTASSRAIPISKMIERVKANPFIPEKWGKPAKGMGAQEFWPVDSPEHISLTNQCRNHLLSTLDYVETNRHNGNKEDLNRYLEPFMWQTAIITATEWDNFFKLRTTGNPDWKIQRVAEMMYDVYHRNPDPIFLKKGRWHCPLILAGDGEPILRYVEQHHDARTMDDLERLCLEIKKKVSVARCARISYLTHEGIRDIIKDLELFEKLRTSGHWSPFEHVASPYFRNTIVENPQFLDLPSGNFFGWKQYRKEFFDENCTFFRK